MLAAVSWYMYLKRPTYTRPHVSADIFENGVISPRFSKKYSNLFCPQKCWNDARKAASFTECALYDEWHHSIWKPQRGFRHCFPLPTGKKQFGVSKTTNLWRFLKTLRYFFCFPKTPFRSVHTCSCYLRGKSTHTEHLWTGPWIYCYKVVLKLLWSCKDRRNWKSCQLFFAIYRMDGILHLPIFYFILFYFSFITQAPRVSYLQVRSDVSCFFGTPGPDSVGEAFPFVIVQSSLWSLMMSETRKDK